MYSRQPRLVTILDAQATTGTGVTVLATDHRNIIVSIATASSANLTVKCQGAIGSTSKTGALPVDFTAAQSATNMWDYLEMVDLQDQTIVIPGDTGFVATGTDDFRQFEINTNGMDYITFTVTARSAGNVTVKARLVTNA